LPGDATSDTAMLNGREAERTGHASGGKLLATVLVRTGEGDGRRLFALPNASLPVA